MNNGLKYSSSIYDSVQDYYRENFNEELSREEIDRMDRGDVLEAYLYWEGIIGYTSIIKKIMGYYDCKLIELESEVK